MIPVGDQPLATILVSNQAETQSSPLPKPESKWQNRGMSTSSVYQLAAATGSTLVAVTPPMSSKDLPESASRPDSIWLAELGPISTLRCLDYVGGEKWRIELPKFTMVCELCYRRADRHFYGVEWDAFSGGWCYLMRHAEGGAGEKICPLNSGWEFQGFCLNGEVTLLKRRGPEASKASDSTRKNCALSEASDRCLLPKNFGPDPPQADSASADWR